MSRTRRGDHDTFPIWDADRGVMVLVDQRVERGVFRFPRTAPPSGRRSCDGVRPVAVALGTDASRIHHPTRWSLHNA